MKIPVLRTPVWIMLLIPLLLTACGGGGGGGGGVAPAPEYTIGGSISGHTDTVLLQNNGADTLAVLAADTTFVFDIGLLSGSSYNVSVLARPAGQTCSVTNGSGTVASANVTNVSVTCEPIPTYSVGGSISGLTGTVVLQNNGGDDLPRNSNGPFAFTTSLPSGSGYNVTILTQPAGQTCTLTNASGTVGSANITNVAVSCVTNPVPTYTIGGTISGLSGTVVLQNNGGDNLTRGADGGFTFATQLVNNAPYDVSVFTQPVGQTCTVSNGSGMVPGANVTGVSVACANNPKSWRTAAPIEANVGNAFFPQVAFDGAGNAIAVWSQSDGVRDNIWANRYTSGSWGTPVLIESNDTGNANSPQVAIDASGNAIAVWSQSNGSRYDIWANRYQAGGNWGTAARINTGNTGDALSPQIAIHAATGNAFVVWQQFEDPRYNIWANRYVFGGGWQSAVRIESDDIGEAVKPQIAADGAGNAIAIWQHSDSIRYNIWVNRYVAGSGWGSPELIETDNNNQAVSPQIAIHAATGNAMAVWQQQLAGSRYDIVANRYVAGAGWGTAAAIETETTHSATSPQVAVDDAGNAIAVWSQFDGARYNIMANRYVSGVAWGAAEELIEIDNLGNATDPQIAIQSATGDAFAVWHQSDGYRTNIWANRYVAGSGWNAGAAEKIEITDAGSASFPQIAIDISGNAFAVWNQSDGTKFDIWANRYD